MATAQPKTPEENGPAPYFLIELSAKTNAYDRDEVFVSVNGKPLVLHRQTPIPLERCYVEALKNAEYEQYEHVPGEDRKRIGRVARFPYRVIRRIYEEAEFRELERAAKAGELTREETKVNDSL